MGTEKANNAPILLAEDQENDVYFMQRAFVQAGLPNPLIPVENGKDAIAYLSGTGVYVDRDRFPMPCLILTDLKMPMVNGFDLLAWLKQQPHLRHIPAIVLTSSDQPEDNRRALELGAAAYWVKPAKVNLLTHLVTEMRNTWIEVHCS
jgi:CheY-like chemotaxis protein